MGDGKWEVRRGHLCKDFLGGHLGVGIELGVAERAAQVAAREAHKHRRAAGVAPLALQRVEDAVHPKHLKSEV